MLLPFPLKRQLPHTSRCKAITARTRTVPHHSYRGVQWSRCIFGEVVTSFGSRLLPEAGYQTQRTNSKSSCSYCFNFALNLTPARCKKTSCSKDT